MSISKVKARVTTANSLLCVGLDSDIDRLPERFRSSETPQYDFNRWIIEQTHAHVCAFKPNMAFYEARGEQGWHELRLTMAYLRENHGDIFTICDAKRADIGNTNRGYARAIFDDLGFDSITLHPYLGGEALAPFLSRTDKVSIILCRTSNPQSAEFQSLVVDGKPLWQHVAENVRDAWNTNENCMLVVGATYPDELRQARAIAPDMPFLVPGVGAQGGDAATTVRAGRDAQGGGLIINASRGIIFADDPATAAKSLMDTINQARAEQLSR